MLRFDTNNSIVFVLLCSKKGPFLKFSHLTFRLWVILQCVHIWCSMWTVAWICTPSLLFSLEQEKVESAASSPLSESAEMEVTEPEPETNDSETAEAKKARLREEQRQKRKAVSARGKSLVGFIKNFRWICRCESRLTWQTKWMWWISLKWILCNIRELILW